MAQQRTEGHREAERFLLMAVFASLEELDAPPSAFFDWDGDQPTLNGEQLDLTNIIPAAVRLLRQAYRQNASLKDLDPAEICHHDLMMIAQETTDG